MEYINQLVKENVLLVAITASILVFIILYWFLAKFFFSNKVISKGEKNMIQKRRVEADPLDRRYEGDMEEDNLPPDDFSEITDPKILKLAHSNFIKEENHISDTIVEGGIIQFKNNNADKLRLLQESEEEKNRSLERLKKSSFNK
jgi:hypothetical protein